MERLDLQIGISIALILDREFANGNLGSCCGKRTATNVVTLFTPEPPAETFGLEVVEGGNLVERPICIDRGRALEVRPQHDFRFRRSEEPSLRPRAKALVVDLSRELLRAFEGFSDGGFAALIPSKGEIGAGGAQCGIDGWIDNLVECFFERGGELKTHAIPERVERPPLRIIGLRALRFEFVFYALQGAGLTGTIEHFLERIPRPGEEEDAVLVLLLFPPRLPVRGDGQLVCLAAGSNDDHCGLVRLDLNLIGRR